MRADGIPIWRGAAQPDQAQRGDPDIEKKNSDMKDKASATGVTLRCLMRFYERIMKRRWAKHDLQAHIMALQYPAAC